MLRGSINNQINFGQWKVIFWASLVEVDKVNTYFPLFSFFKGNDNVDESIQIVRFPNNIGFDELSVLGQTFFF